MDYSSFEIRETAAFAEWLAGLRDVRGRARIIVRLQRLANGHFGDVRPIGEGVSELRIHSGPGYRVYFVRRGARLILLLGGGDKDSQARDITLALNSAHDLDWERDH